MAKKIDADSLELIKTWSLDTSATFGSVVRIKGIVQEVRARLPLAVRKSLEQEANVLTLAMPGKSRAVFRAASVTVTDILADIVRLLIIPREIEDILTITTTERRRWLEDGRLPSAGTRTVKLRGRARAITFHVFDPAKVADILDRGLVDEWREDDAAMAAENRRKSAMKAKLTRSLKKRDKTKCPSDAGADQGATKLRGWDDFVGDGLLR